MQCPACLFAWAPIRICHCTRRSSIPPRPLQASGVAARSLIAGKMRAVTAAAEHQPWPCTNDNTQRRQRLQDMVAQLKQRYPVPSITPREVENARQSDTGAALVLVDVRTPAEIAVSRIPGALTKEAFEAQREEFKRQGATVVAYCTIGYRSSLYTQELLRQGFDARNLEGSVVAWTQEALPLVAGAGDAQAGTTRVHVFGRQWELQGDGYEAVVFERPLLSLVAAALKGALPGWLGGGT